MTQVTAENMVEIFINTWNARWNQSHGFGKVVVEVGIGSSLIPLTIELLYQVPLS